MLLLFSMIVLEMALFVVETLFELVYWVLLEFYLFYFELMLLLWALGYFYFSFI